MFQVGQKAQHYISGSFCDSVSGETFKSVCPANGDVLSEVSLGGKADIAKAVAAAKAALHEPAWSQLKPNARAQLLRRIGEKIKQHHADLARLESLDTGKPLRETMEGDIPRAFNNFFFYADLAAHQSLPSYHSDDGSLHLTYRHPVGVCGLITPWNLPLYLETWKLAPALAQGNTVVLKPAELTPLTARALADILQECDLPAGVVNIVQGFGPDSAGEALATHPDVRAISFTGETSTGVAIMKAAAPSLKKLSFELGGKGVNCVFADADLAKAAEVVTRSAFRNQGQVCLAGSRLLVEERIATELIDRIINEMKKIRVGDPLNQETTMGALISREHRDKVASYVDFARTDSQCEMIYQGTLTSDLAKGAYFPPTLIKVAEQNSKMIQEEIFGPVLTVQTFKSADEAMNMVNGTQYGLSGSIWTNDLAKAKACASAAQMGLLWINGWFNRDLHAAFGGMKRSGVGREGGQHSLDFFCELKTVTYCP